METLTQVFSCEFCEISKNPILTERLQRTASGFSSFPATLLERGAASSV